MPDFTYDKTQPDPERRGAAAGRIWRVDYNDVPLYLTYEEYEALKRAADNPDEALRMADEFLAREQADR